MAIEQAMAVDARPRGVVRRGIGRNLAGEARGHRAGRIWQPVTKTRPHGVGRVQAIRRVVEQAIRRQRAPIGNPQHLGTAIGDVGLRETVAERFQLQGQIVHRSGVRRRDITGHG